MKTQVSAVKGAYHTMWETDMYTKICSMTAVLGRGDEGYRWGQEWEDVTSLEGDKSKVSN